jgi:hypothetical protein
VLVLINRAQSRRTLEGTARVLSVHQFAPNYLTDQRGRTRCRIELEVNIPGREPYVKFLKQQLKPAEQAAAKPGRTLRVAFDPKRPKYFWVDFSQQLSVED